MKGLLFSIFFLLIPCAFAQDADQSSSDSGVLVSSGAPAQVSGQDNSDSPEHQNHQRVDGSGGTSSRENMDNTGKGLDTSNDDIVLKATNALIFQMTANLKLTPDQASAIGPIVTGYIVKVRGLEQSLKDGTIDSKTMYAQRQQLTIDEDKELSSTLTSDQLKTWVSIQDQYDS